MGSLLTRLVERADEGGGDSAAVDRDETIAVDAMMDITAVLLRQTVEAEAEVKKPPKKNKPKKRNGMKKAGGGGKGGGRGYGGAGATSFIGGRSSMFGGGTTDW